MGAKGRSGSVECFVLSEWRDGVGADGLAEESRSGRGAGAFDELDRVLIERATAWAQGLGDGPVSVVDGSGAPAAPSGSTADTVVLLHPALVRLGPRHASDLLEDLENGCNLVIGPTLAGGWYLLAMRPGDPELIDAAGRGEAGSAGRLLAAARNREGLEVGLLRAERDLGSESDLRAAAADPLVDIEVAGLLTGLLVGRRPDRLG